MRPSQSPHAVRRKSLTDIGSYENVLRTFRLADTNGDGRLSQLEMHHLMTTLNQHTWEKKDTQQLFAQLDRDRKGHIDIEEFIAFIFTRKTATGGSEGMSVYEQVMEIFRAKDTNRNGTMDPMEFTSLMIKLCNGRWNEQCTQEIWHELDIDRSGEVDSAELVAYLFDVPMPHKDPKKRRHSHSRMVRPLVLEIACGRGQSATKAAMMRAAWLQKFGHSLAIDIVTVEGASHISKVGTSNGKVVLWDRATMIGFREDPFKDLETMRTWIDTVAARDIPRLLGKPCTPAK